MNDDLEQLSDEQLVKLLEQSRILIKEGGEVIIENLTEGLLEVARELNPDDPGLSCRLPPPPDEEEPDTTP